MDSGDDRYSTAGVGRDWTLIPGPDCVLIDIIIPLKTTMKIESPRARTQAGKAT
jgi:hypothetical protein